jgi:transposase
LSGDDPMADPLPRWFASFHGRGAGVVTRDGFPGSVASTDPYDQAGLNGEVRGWVSSLTVYRWVQRFTPLLAAAARFAWHAPSDRWFVDETYMRVNGVWRYVHPKWSVVERTLAWLTTHRRLARDYERDPSASEEMIRWAAISQMLRCLTRGKSRPSAATPNPTPGPSQHPSKTPSYTGLSAANPITGSSPADHSTVAQPLRSASNASRRTVRFSLKSTATS